MRPIIFVALLLLPTLVHAQPQAKPAPDHGRVMACCLDVFPHKLKDTTNLADTKNYVFRGKVISLGKDKNVSICYDVEHMRVAGAWVGKPFAYTSEKNMGPSVEGEMLFATRPGPGWAKDGKWDDPRIGGEGPLPRDWVHYKGLYVHGDKVVLSYRVGDMEVLEMPEVIEKDGLTTIVRTFNIGPSKLPNTILLQTTEVKINSDGKPKDRLKSDPTKWMLRVGNEKDPGFFAHAADLNDKGLLRWENNRLIVELQAGAKSTRFSVFQTKIDKDTPYGDFWKRLIAIEKLPVHDLSQFTKAGPPRWTQTVETAITLGDAKSGPYTLDQIAPPEKNPWNASVRFAGLDFFPDGRAALSTWDGDVWIVSGLDGKSTKATWKRFASGLQQPLGLKIINGFIYIAGRDQITKLHDFNNDGEADFYENINNDQGLTLQRHEFVMDLQTDKDGNLYFCRSGHYIQSKRGDNCVIYKMSPDGAKLEKFATGFREPNGMSISSDDAGIMTVADNEGNGIPQTPIYRLLPGKNYGFTPPAPWKKEAGGYKFEQQPIVWLGPKIDTSAGGQVWAPGRAEPRKGPVDDGINRPLTGLGSPKPWGPLAGQLLHTSYGNCALFSVLIDKTAEPWQGAVWKFPLQFNSGIMRARFNPVDGQLYVCGLRGWGTSAVKDGQFARVRYTGNDLPIPVGYRVVKAGIEIAFSTPLDKASAEDEENWAGTWSGVLKKVPSAKEMQEMPITSTRLSDDRKTVTIMIDKLRPVPNFALQYRVKSAMGASVSGELNGTVHRVP